MPVNVPPAILGPDVAAGILNSRAPGIFWGSFCWKTPTPIKFLVLGGLFFLKGGGCVGGKHGLIWQSYVFKPSCERFFGLYLIKTL